MPPQDKRNRRPLKGLEITATHGSTLGRWLTHGLAELFHERPKGSFDDVSYTST
jgi:hypothetical protein